MRGFKSLFLRHAQIAQLVEQWIEAPRVGSSTLSLGTRFRDLVQLVERRSPKPDVTGSSPVIPAIYGPVAQPVRAHA